MPTIECMHERMQPEHDYCPDCGETQTAESRAIRTLRTRAERAEAELAVVRARAEKLQADADARLGDPRDIPADTGHREADRLICRLVSDDPDFQDCTDAVVLIRRLIADSKGPDEFATWKDAAVDERMKRVAAETERDTLRAELAALRAERDTWKGIAGEYSDCLQDLCMTRLYDICRPVSHSWPGRKHVLSIRQAVDFLLERAEKAEAEVERLRKGIAAVSALIADSSGVYGLHLNGDPAPWDELLSGGRFEEWLADFDAARSES